jgi:hypothetical protein
LNLDKAHKISCSSGNFQISENKRTFCVRDRKGGEE